MSEAAKPRPETGGNPIYTKLAIALLILLFMAVNVISGQTLRSARVDLTEKELYSLSEDTRALLAGLDEPIHMRLYLSDELVQSAAPLAAYATRVRSILETYADLSGGTITLEVIDPEPFSEEEDRAVGLGVQQLPMPGSQNPMFLGLAATNSTDGAEVIPVFTPDRERFLEYDLTRLVAALGQPAKPVIAVFDAIGMHNDPSRAGGAQHLYALLEEIYDVRLIAGDLETLPEDTRMVLIAHPQGLLDQAVYAIDQWVLSGGATLIFVDPHAEALGAGMAGADPTSTLEQLFEAWGVDFTEDRAVVDPNYALRAVREINGRSMEVPQPAWLGLRSAALDTDDATLSQLSSIIMTTAGAFSAERDDIELATLIAPTGDAGLVPTEELLDSEADPRRLVAGLTPADMPPILAARLKGALKTAFPDGPPAEDGETLPEAAVAAHRDTLAGEANVVLIGDADMLMDRNWVQQRQLFGQSVAQAFANNGDFVLNLVEQMAGGAALANLRGRQVNWRPFERINELERAAEERFLATEEALRQRITDTEAELRGLAPGQGTDEAVLSSERVAAVDQLRADLLAARAELRDVQFKLHRDVERLKSLISIINVGLVPLAVAGIALLIALRRPRRAVPQRTAPSA